MAFSQFVYFYGFIENNLIDVAKKCIINSPSEPTPFHLQQWFSMQNDKNSFLYAKCCGKYIYQLNYNNVGFENGLTV